MTTAASRILRRAIVLFSLALIAIAGCGADELETPTAKKLKGIANMYLDYAFNVNKNVGPANEKDFKRFLSGQPEHVLNGNGMDPKAIDDAFVSARDSAPFVIIYDIKITGISGKEAAVVAHEKVGKNGRYLVGMANGKVQLVDEAKLTELKTPKEQ